MADSQLDSSKGSTDNINIIVEVVSGCTASHPFPPISFAAVELVNYRLKYCLAFIYLKINVNKLPGDNAETMSMSDNNLFHSGQRRHCCFTEGEEIHFMHFRLGGR